MSNSLKNVISDRSISWNHIPPIPIITLLLVEDTSSLWVQLCWFFFWYHRPLLPIPRSDLRIHWLLQNLWHSWHSLHQKDFYRVACTWTCQWLKFMKPMGLEGEKKIWILHYQLTCASDSLGRCTDFGRFLATDPHHEIWNTSSNCRSSSLPFCSQHWTTFPCWNCHDLP